MKSLFLTFSSSFLFLLSSLGYGQTTKNDTLDVQKKFEVLVQNIASEPINHLLMQQNGRLKPFDTLARESFLFIFGSYKPLGLSPVATYLGLAFDDHSRKLELVEIRDVQLRTELGFPKEKRYYSLVDLETTGLNSLVEPLMKKQQMNSRALNEHEKKIIEVYQQVNLLEEIVSGQSFLFHADFSEINSTTESVQSLEKQKEFSRGLVEVAKKYFATLDQNQNEQKKVAQELIDFSLKQPVPEMFQHYQSKVELEIFYHQARLFLIAGFLAIFLGICFFTSLFKDKVSFFVKKILFLVPLLIVATGIGIRVYITEFAPVTNMYGTMIWVALGSLVFSFLILAVYQNLFVPGVSLIASGGLLLLTERMPLVLSPDLDPIVAVLRSNFWLSTHVTTITISYAAFTIAMVLGNITLVRLWFYKDNKSFIKEYSHYAYRMIQLGCFLLTVGIILGGIWADYSWGRFWGWDPKETWALIADLGFLILLHGRFAGWVSLETLLILAPVAYLLVIMAWYGVNFILAAGLHSYGFSSGGTAFVTLFLLLQVLVFVFGILGKYKSSKPDNQVKDY